MWFEFTEFTEYTDASSTVAGMSTIADGVVLLNSPVTRTRCSVEVDSEDCDWELGDERSKRSVVSTSSSYNGEEEISTGGELTADA